MGITGVMIDNREPAMIQNLQFEGAPLVRLQLEIGDLWASTADRELLIIERKTPDDLLGSIKDGRLFNQVAAMRTQSKWIYLVITGALAHSLDGMVITDSRLSGWRWDDVQGALLTVQELGCAVVVCQSDQHYEQAIIRLAKRDRKAVKPIMARVEPHILTEQERVLLALPGIGLERAGLLLGEFGSASYAIAWLTWLNTFAEVSGIGDGTKHNVRRALGLQPEEWLAVMDTEKARYAAEFIQEESTQLLGV